MPSSEKRVPTAHPIPLHIRLENITPILAVKDMSRSRRFYVDILGFEEAEWGNDDFTAVSRDGKGLYLCQNNQGQPGTWIWIGFDGDMNELHRQLLDRGVVARMPPANFYYAYEMHIEDPDGHVIRLGTDPDPNQPFVELKF